MRPPFSPTIIEKDHYKPVGRNWEIAKVRPTSLWKSISSKEWGFRIVARCFPGAVGCCICDEDHRITRWSWTDVALPALQHVTCRSSRSYSTFVQMSNIIDVKHRYFLMWMWSDLPTVKGTAFMVSLNVVANLKANVYWHLCRPKHVRHVNVEQETPWKAVQAIPAIDLL